MDTEINIAWAAGFLDGEGCFSLLAYGGNQKNIHPTTRQPALAVCQARREPLDRLAKMFGGNVRVLKGRGWQWAICGAKLQEVIPPLLPHLTIKRAEAEAVLEYAKTVRRRGRVAIPEEELALRKTLIEQHESARRWWV